MPRPFANEPEVNALLERLVNLYEPTCNCPRPESHASGEGGGA